MADFAFECLDVAPEHYGVAPTLLFRLRINETTGTHVHTIALRCQIRIEPQRRRYTDDEAEGLTNLFGERSRWGDTLKPMQWATVPVLVGGFTGSTEVEVPVPCSYDLEVAAGKYFHALADGVVPLALLFSGTVFGTGGGQGLWVRQIPWDATADCRLPVRVLRELMDEYFPDSAWLRLRRDTVDELLRYKARRALPTWDATLAALLEAGRVRD